MIQSRLHGGDKTSSALYGRYMRHIGQQSQRGNEKRFKIGRGIHICRMPYYKHSGNSLRYSTAPESPDGISCVFGICSYWRYWWRMPLHSAPARFLSKVRMMRVIAAIRTFPIWNHRSQRCKPFYGSGGLAWKSGANPFPNTMCCGLRPQMRKVARSHGRKIQGLERFCQRSEFAAPACRNEK